MPKPIFGHLLHAVESFDWIFRARRNASGNRTFQVVPGAGFATAAYRHVNSDTNALVSDFIISVDASVAPRAVTLPPASAMAGLHIIVIKADSTSNVVAVHRFGSDTLGFAGAATRFITTQNGRLWHVSDGVSRWLILL